MEDEFDFISLAALTANVVRWIELTAPNEQRADQDRQEYGQDEGRAEDREHGRGQAVDQALNKKTAL